MMKKLYSLLLILTPFKKVHAFQKFMSVLITFVAINYDELLKKDFAWKYFLEVNVVVIRTNPPSMINHMLPSLFLELVIFYPWKCWNRCRGVFRTRQVSMMGLFGVIVFTKKSFIDFRLGSKYDSVMEEDTWKVAFFKIPKISQKITILEYSFSKVVSFKEKCNFYFCVTPKNYLVKIIKKYCHKKLTELLQLWWSELFNSNSFFNISDLHNGFVWNLSKVQSSLFERIARFL